MSRDPAVEIRFSGGKIELCLGLCPNPAALRARQFPDRQELEIPAQILTDAAMRHWSGSFPLEGRLEESLKAWLENRGIQVISLPDRIEFSLEITLHEKIRNPFKALHQLVRGRERRPVNLYYRPGFWNIAYTASPFYRRFWGIFRYPGHPECLGLNWSPHEPGYIFIPSSYEANWAERVMAHELGHIMGIGDAYGAWYRAYYAVPGTECYLMHSNGPVHAEELAMVLDADRSGRMQFFPYEIEAERIATGFLKQFRFRLGTATRKIRKALARTADFFGAKKT